MTQIRPQPIAAKVEPYRKLAYRQHIARQPCMACGYAFPNDQGYICQAAHIKRLGKEMSKGKKNHDYFTIPLCGQRFDYMHYENTTVGCHAKFDASQEAFARDTLKCTLDELKLEAFADWQAWCKETGTE